MWAEPRCGRRAGALHGRAGTPVERRGALVTPLHHASSLGYRALPQGSVEHHHHHLLTQPRSPQAGSKLPSFASKLENRQVRRFPIHQIFSYFQTLPLSKVPFKCTQYNKGCALLHQI